VTRLHPVEKYIRDCYHFQKVLVNDLKVDVYINSDKKSWGSSVNIVPGYRLDGRGSILAEENDFSSSPCVQTRFEVHPASYTVGVGGPFSV
jgi:hypothetical protein